MNNLPHDMMPSTAQQYPDDFALSNSYRQLEGFTATGSKSSPLTMTDFYKETTVVVRKSPHHLRPHHLLKDSWTDALITFAVMLALLIVSSVALGLAAKQATVITQQLTRRATQQTLGNAASPNSWKF